MSMIFGFSDDEIAPLPDSLTDQVESTVHLSDGATHTDAGGNTYTTNAKDN
ncbi:hypothetical protein OG413_46360 [Streptomyces sp. NBC_01433]|uniref:hypothetical protein n=1 Tax=Streptomyces sp. NBC_01433 TaxID=2903864 RepID=UPI00225B14CD|nr:hypothetical protein [Streptomyces sp. NBC_01433]MCX4682612.1 hypothetical protein [Streptomyces sp. NBC_01433]